MIQLVVEWLYPSDGSYCEFGTPIMQVNIYNTYDIVNTRPFRTNFLYYANGAINIFSKEDNKIIGTSEVKAGDVIVTTVSLIIKTFMQIMEANNGTMNDATQIIHSFTKLTERFIKEKENKNENDD